MNDINEIRNSFEQEMVDKGYKIFKSGWNNSLRGFQKRFDDEYGKKYFITIWHYNHGEQSGREDIKPRDTYTADTQFTFNKFDTTCNIEYWGEVLPNEYRKNISLSHIESFFEDFWNKMKPDYYEI